METQWRRNSPGKNVCYADRPVSSDVLKSSNVTSEEGASSSTRVVWTAICLFYIVLVAGVLPGLRGGGAREYILQLNDMFDRVWCPLPTWAHILLVIAAWALFFRVGANLLKTIRNK